MSALRPAAQHVLKRFELYLALGAAVFVGVVFLMFHANTDTGLTVAVTVIGMGLLQAAIQWADLERSAGLRRRQIHEIREMLRDQVLNQLSAVKMWVSEPPDPDMAELLVEEVNDSVDAIARLIDQLSEHQLDTWKLTYANAADHIAMTSAPLDAMPTRLEAVPGAAVRPTASPRGRVPDVDVLLEDVGAPALDAPGTAPVHPEPLAHPLLGTMIVRAETPEASNAPPAAGPTVAMWH